MKVPNKKFQAELNALKSEIKFIPSKITFVEELKLAKFKDWNQVLDIYRRAKLSKITNFGKTFYGQLIQSCAHFQKKAELDEVVKEISSWDDITWINLLRAYALTKQFDKLSNELKKPKHKLTYSAIGTFLSAVEPRDVPIEYAEAWEHLRNACKRDAVLARATGEQWNPLSDEDNSILQKLIERFNINFT